MNEKINFCRPGVMSMCMAPEPKNCKFFQPSTYHVRCMFQSLELSDGWHCGCADAQSSSRNEEKALEDAIELIEESEEGIIPT